MKSFDEVMEITRGVSSSPALSDEEAKALYDACETVPVGGIVVEVGCQLGRSSSLITQCGAGKFHTIHIDPYTLQDELLQHWHKMMWTVGGTWTHEYTHLCMRTEQAEWLLNRLGSIDMAFIDGDHEYTGVMIDLQILCPLIKSGGILTMHDYGRDSLPGVYQAASEYIDGNWEHLGTHYTLGVWRKR